MKWKFLLYVLNFFFSLLNSKSWLAQFWLIGWVSLNSVSWLNIGGFVKIVRIGTVMIPERQKTVITVLWWDWYCNHIEDDTRCLIVSNYYTWYFHSLMTKRLWCQNIQESLHLKCSAPLYSWSGSSIGCSTPLYSWSAFLIGSSHYPLYINSHFRF